MHTIDFWYEFASTYSYPAAMLIEEQAEQAGVCLRWRPFLLGPIFYEQSGWQDSPFNIYPEKGKYMWRDLERLCVRAGLPFQKPAHFPQNGLLAARVALVGERDGWISDFSKAIYTANFAKNQSISDESVVRGCLSETGADVDKVLTAATSEENKNRLKAQTLEAKQLGLFGAPTFVVGEELFWGQDRLTHAVEWAATH